MLNPGPPFDNPDVEDRYRAIPEPERSMLLTLRKLVFDTAAATPEAGPLDECLKWGEPAYLTSATGSGTAVRLGRPKQGGVALYVHCRTTLISDHAGLFADDCRVEGNRAIHIDPTRPLPEDRLAILIRAALTYRLLGT